MPAEESRPVHGSDSISLLTSYRINRQFFCCVLHVASGQQTPVWIAKVDCALAAVKQETDHMKAVPVLRVKKLKNAGSMFVQSW